MKKLDGYFNFDDNANNNKASEEEEVVSVVFVVQMMMRPRRRQRQRGGVFEKIRGKAKKRRIEDDYVGNKDLTSISDRDALDAYFSAKSNSSQAASVASSSLEFFFRA